MYIVTLIYVFSDKSLHFTQNYIFTFLEECKEEKLQHHAACEYTRPMLCKDVSAYMGHCPKTCDTCGKSILV